jgi:hypothetical protein
MAPELAQTPLPAPALSVRPWLDTVVDALGHDPRSPYVEHFWLPVLGPTATFLVRRLAEGLDRAPDGFDLPLADTARALGLGMRAGRGGPFVRAIHRCCQFGAARLAGDATLEVRRRLPPLSRIQVGRLPDHLKDAHARWQEAQVGEARGPVMVDRARRLAASLLELGESPGEAEAQLGRWRFDPQLAAGAVAWAGEQLARRGAPAAPPLEPLDAA